MRHVFCQSCLLLRIFISAALLFLAKDAVLAEQLPADFPSIFKCYTIQGKDAGEIGHALAPLPALKVDVDSKKNRLLIWATVENHREIRSWLESTQCLMALNPSAGKKSSSGVVPATYAKESSIVHQEIELAAGRNQPPPLPPQQNPPNLPAIPNVPQRQMRSIVLKNLSAVDFEKRLLDNLGRRFIDATPVAASTKTAQYQLPLANGQTLDMAIDRRQNTVIISGTDRSVDSFVQVITLMDNDSTNPNIETELIPYSPSNTRAVNEAIRAIGKNSQVVYQQEAPLPSASQNNPAGTELSIRQPPVSPQVNQGFIIPGGAGLVGPVTVEILDDGIVVVRGNDNDVKIVKEMLQHLETISMEHEPKIYLHQLVHADSTRVATMLRQLYTEIYQSRKGNISITALVKPNAILLIGYEGSIEAAMELMTKLDITVDAETQFQVFRLRFATAATLKSSIDEFYSDRTALGATVVATSDVRTNSLIVQASPRDLMEIAALVLKLDVGSGEKNGDMKVIPLMNTLASELAPIIQQALTGSTTTQGGFGGGNTGTEQSTVLTFKTIDQGQNKVIKSDVFTDVRVTADTRGNNIIVVAPEKCLPLIEALVYQLDAAPKAIAQIKVFTIVNSDASTLLTMLNNLFSTTQTGGTSQPAVRTGAGNSESSLVPVRFAADTRTNSIVASGSEGDLSIVEAILIRLDEKDLSNRRVVVYRLLNTPCEQVATALNEYLTNDRSVRQSSEVLQGDVDRFNAEVIVVAEAETNSLIISTTPRYYEQIKLIIKQLDDRPPMVSIAVLIAEVTLSDTDELGFEVGLQDSILFDRGVLSDIVTQTTTTQNATGQQVQNQTIISSTTNPGFGFGDTSQQIGNNGSTTNNSSVGTQGITNFALGRQSEELGYSGFMFAASSESVSILIRALEEKKKLTVLNKPTLTTLHNQESYLKVGQTVQRITGSSTNEAGGQNTSMTDTDVGVILKITPRVSADGRIVMTVDATKSSLGTAADGTPIGVGANGSPIISPNINAIQIQTTISASTGQTIVLGGLINSEVTSVHRAVPLISKIPIVGQLFQYNYNKCARRELLFIMTPRILQSDEEIRAMTQLETSRMAWCANSVANMMGDNTVKKRTDDWSTSETNIERGEVFQMEEGELMPSEQIIDRSTIEGLPLPQMAPPKK